MAVAESASAARVTSLTPLFGEQPTMLRDHYERRRQPVTNQSCGSRHSGDREAERIVDVLLVPTIT
jgi:hypothetical protein